MKYEFNCYRWIQLSGTEIEEFEKENDEFDRCEGCKYIDPFSGLTMTKLHVDDLDNKHEELEDTEFGDT